MLSLASPPLALQDACEIGADWFVAESRPTLRRALAIGRRLRQYRPDIIQFTFMSKLQFSNLILKIVSGSWRLIVADHSSGGVRSKPAVGAMLSLLRGRLTGLYIDRVIVVSEFIRRRDVDGLKFSSGKVALVYNGVDVEKYAPDQQMAEARKEFGCDVPVIAYAGQLIPEKGVATLLDAASKLLRSGVRVRLRIAGKGRQERELRQFCENTGISEHVEFLGHISWVSQLFSTADIVVVPSVSEEAFGLVAAKAMACGAWLLVSDAGGIPEVVGGDGVPGWIYCRGDADDLADKLRLLSNDPSRRLEMKAAARKRVIQQFTVQQMASGYLNVYGDLLGVGGETS